MTDHFTLAVAAVETTTEFHNKLRRDEDGVTFAESLGIANLKVRLAHVAEMRTARLAGQADTTDDADTLPAAPVRGGQTQPADTWNRVKSAIDTHVGVGRGLASGNDRIVLATRITAALTGSAQ